MLSVQLFKTLFHFELNFGPQYIFRDYNVWTFRAFLHGGRVTLAEGLPSKQVTLLQYVL